MGFYMAESKEYIDPIFLDQIILYLEENETEF